LVTNQVRSIARRGAYVTEHLRKIDRPLLVAHRAGNDLARLRMAEELGADLVEADVWRYRGRLEIRHEKTTGPLPVLWDRWSLAPGWTPRFKLAELLQLAAPETVLFFDLKGWSQRLPEQMLSVLRERAPGRPYAVSSRNWGMLDLFWGRPEATVFFSVGNPRQYRAILARLERDGPLAVSIHARLLDQRSVQCLTSRGALVVPWQVTSLAHAQRLLAWGVDGVSVDDLRILRDLKNGCTSPNRFA
jgi:glycerophosphoryl diester phosphodiesterase